MISPAVIRAKGELLTTKIEYTTRIVHNNKFFFILIGSSRVFFFSDDFSLIQAEIDHKNIERIIISTSNPNLFQMHMNDQRNKNVPAKMNIHCLNRRILINNLRYVWKTNYLCTILEVRDLPTYKAKFDDTKHTTYQQKGPARLLILMEPQESQGFMRFLLNGYVFWLPRDFTASKESGIYRHSSVKTCYFNIQIGETQPLEVLHLIGDRISLQFYAESFMDQLISQEMAELEQKKNYRKQSSLQDEKESEDENDDSVEVMESNIEGRNKVNDFWIISSNQQIKRENIINDPAEWTGWQVQARTQKKDIILIIMRRKYIPPLMENYNEVVVVFYGPEGLDTLKQDEQQEEEDDQKKDEEDLEEDEDEDEEEDKPDKQENGKLLQAAYEQMNQGREFLNIMTDVADKFQSIYNVEEKYDTLMRVSLNGLMLDDETLYFYQQRLGFVPSYIIFGIKLMSQHFDSLATELITEAPKCKTLKKLLEYEYQNEIKENSDLAKLVDDARKGKKKEDIKEPDDIIQFFENHGPKGDQRRVWCYKLSRYLAYCFNGGLLGDKYTLKDLFVCLDNTTNLSPSGRDRILKMLDYFLFALPESSGGAVDFLLTDVTRRIQKVVSQKYVYNIGVLDSMLKYDLFSNEFLKKDQMVLYTELMIYVLTNTTNASSKICACQHIIQYQASLKGTISDAIINAFKPLIGPLMSAYRSPNRLLSTFGCVALFNMCTNSQEFKYMIIQQNGTNLLLNKLKSKDSNELTYTLKLIHILLSIVQHLEIFMQFGIVDSMFSIIAGTAIKGAFYSAETLIATCQILKVCLFGTYEFKSLNTALDLLIKLYLVDSNNYMLNETLHQTLQLETLNLIGKICLQHPSQKDNLNQKLVPSILNTLMQAKNNTLELVKIDKLIFFLCIMIQDDREAGANWIEQQPFLLDALLEFEKVDVKNSNFLMRELTFKEKIIKK